MHGAPILWGMLHLCVINTKGTLEAPRGRTSRVKFGDFDVQASLRTQLCIDVGTGKDSSHVK